ncbi:hypothetical protein WAX74_15625 [Psychrobacillus sp. FJAT-51614]|uniref:ABC transporter permease n=1 Tax=Psychrobacillus mangrovi TaxID=3117745 RepID=A0ABU8F7R5_9BACI
MSQWGGLLWKEWMIYKTFIYLAIIVNIPVVVLGPLLIGRIFNVEQNYGIHVLIISAMLGFLYVLGMVFIFFSSLEREMKRPDIWFHTAASSFKLVGAKLVSISLYNIILLACIGIATIIASLLFSKFNVVPISSVIKLELGLIITVILSTITFTIGIFAMWVVARMIRQINAIFSNVVAVILYFIAFHYYTKFIESNFYRNLTDYGAVKLPEIGLGEVSSENFYITYHLPDNIFIGDIVFEILFFTFLFIVSVYAFDKKVRG